MRRQLRLYRHDFQLKSMLLQQYLQATHPRGEVVALHDWQNHHRNHEEYTAFFHLYYLPRILLSDTLYLQHQSRLEEEYSSSTSMDHWIVQVDVNEMLLASIQIHLLYPRQMNLSNCRIVRYILQGLSQKIP